MATDGWVGEKWSVLYAYEGCPLRCAATCCKARGGRAWISPDSPRTTCVPHYSVGGPRGRYAE